MFGREKTNKMEKSGMTDSSPDSREHATENEEPVPGTESTTVNREVSRRTLLKGGGAALAGLTVLQVAGPAHAFPSGEEDGNDDQPDTSQSLGRPGDVVIPWLDQPPPFPAPDFGGSQLVWEELNSWLTPPEKFHFVTHDGIPTGLDNPAAWRVAVAGLVRHRLSLSLADLKDRPRREIDFTLECSGNHGTGLPVATGFIGNARWADTPLAPVLEEAGLLKGGVEIVFYGIDRGTPGSPRQLGDRGRWADSPKLLTPSIAFLSNCLSAFDASTSTSRVDERNGDFANVQA